MSGRKKRNIPLALKIVIVFFLVALIIGTLGGYKLYNILYKPNVLLINNEQDYIYIPTGAVFDDVLSILHENNILLRNDGFVWLAKKKNYPNHVKAGRYQLKSGMSNNELVNLLRSGKQAPINVIFNNIRTKENLAGRIAKQIEADSLKILELTNSSVYLEKFNFSPVNILAMFLPNTYEFYWNTSAEEFVERMYNEYNAFWNEERKKQASRIGLTPVEVSVLASIVQAETNKRDEMPRVAGVYLNRLKRGMLLQADPTVVYAWGDFSLQRVLHRHLEIDSPYNTYKYAGLPPGPILLPELFTINSVLNYEKHDYLFFCAKDDFSGYHVFAKTHSQHINNARRYHNALNRQGLR